MPSMTAMAMGSSPPPDDTPARRGLRQRSSELRSRAENARQALTAQADSLRARSATARLAFDAYDRDRRHAGALLAGGLAYRLFLWMLPLSLTVASAVGIAADLTSRTPEAVAGRAGLGGALTATIARAAEESGRGALVLVLIGLWLLVWAGKSVVKALRLLAGVAWQVRPEPLRHGIKASLLVSGIMVVLIATPVLLRPLHAGPPLTDVLVWIGTALAATPVFAWGFSRLPHPPGLPWTAFIGGAALLAGGLELLRVVTTVYFVDRLERVEDLYGALGAAAVFMVWLFVIGRLVVGAMTLNATRAEALFRDGADGPPP